MKPLLIFLFIGFSSYINAQKIDYNTKKGIAVEGYDVVAYFNNKAKKGSSKFTSQYDGVTYKFSNQKHLDLFEANPNSYLPQYGGYCAYAIAVKGKKVGIDPKTFEIREGKLYLFYNAWGTNTLNSWKRESPDTLVVQSDKNWESIKDE